MTNDQIEKFVEPRHLDKEPVRISFKTRNTFNGIFIQSRDYEDLKSKNYWRIVSETHLNEWNRTHDQNLSRIFHGGEFTRLTDLKKA